LDFTFLEEGTCRNINKATQQQMKGIINMSTAILAIALSRPIKAFTNKPKLPQFQIKNVLFSTKEQTKRIPRGTISGLDARTVTENLEMIKSHLTSRKASPETITAAETIASLNEKRVLMIQQRDTFLQERKIQSEIVGKLMRMEEKDEGAINEAKGKSADAAKGASGIEEELSVLEGNVGVLLKSLPNLLDDVVPDGEDEEDNEEVLRWGDESALPKQLNWGEVEGFTPLWHDDIAIAMDGWKASQAVSMSGSRFVALSGSVAKLERAISSFFLDVASNEHEYTEVSPPYIVSRSTLEGTGQLPKFEDDLFKITPESHTCNGEDAFLIPTAEVPLTNMLRDTILEEADLPISYVALTPCFRAEAGSYGRDTRGLIRSHQFQKVELVKITTPSTSNDQHELLTSHAEKLLQLLELPYRKVRLCSGDIGFGAQHCYDLEVWLPGQGIYKEISSCSNCGDFQARRMGLRYRPNEEEETQKGKKKKKKKARPQFCHTINGSGLAVGRTLVAILENYQLGDGEGIAVPKVLRGYLGGLTELKK